ncbi:hypothetical protein WG66_014582 [Moniliophthora roreri]|nr:hypothetical protein WG66_014582 [Moniliophthora roreri]
MVTSYLLSCSIARIYRYARTAVLRKLWSRSSFTEANARPAEFVMSDFNIKEGPIILGFPQAWYRETYPEYRDVDAFDLCGICGSCYNCIQNIAAIEAVNIQG